MTNYELNPYIVACGQMSLERNPVPGIMFPPRVVRWYELELIIDSIDGHIINIDHRIPTKKGTLMIRKPGSVVVGISSYSCISIAFDSYYDKALSSYYSENMFTHSTKDLLSTMKTKTCPLLDSLPESIELVNFTALHELFQKALNIYITKDSRYDMTSKYIMFEILQTIDNEIELTNKANHQTTNKVAYEAVKQVKQYIELYYMKSITLAQLAKTAGYSKEAFSRLFKTQVGFSPIDYVIEQRMIKAKHLLITTTNTIYDISDICGFKNDTYFYTSFKKREGISPSLYRLSHTR